MRMEARRWAKQDDCKVSWGNQIGPYSGQSGTYVFATTEDAASFATFARGEDFPALDNGHLAANGVPIPLTREDRV